MSKTYEPEIIDTYALPETIVEEETGSTNYEGKKVASPSTKVSEKFPVKSVARETIGEALNTRTKQILGTFTFGQVGAISIGVYENGVSGDIRITPNGITARDLNGITTFSIDGTTGDAVFKGTVQAGSIISGSVISDSIISGEINLGGLDNVDGLLNLYDNSGVKKIVLDKSGITLTDATIIIDGVGLNSVNNFQFGVVTDTNANNTSSGNYADVPNMSLTFTLTRAARVLFLVSYMGGGYTATDSCYVIARLELDGSQVGGIINAVGIETDAGFIYTTVSMQTVEAVSSGEHTIKLRFKRAGSGTAYISSNLKSLIYLVLGK
jgi:hypothetical protein